MAQTLKEQTTPRGADKRARGPATLSRIERDLKAYELHLMGCTVRGVCDELNISSTQTAFNAINRGRDYCIERGIPTEERKIEIDKLYIRGTGGKFWKAEHIASGKNFLCTETTASDYESFVNIQAGLLGNTNKARLKTLSERENHFVAVSKSAPMMETFSSIRWKDNTSIITGDIRKAEKP
jgi:hypothetical protein